MATQTEAATKPVSVQRRQQVVKYLQEARHLLEQQLNQASMGRNGMTQNQMEKVCRAALPNGDFDILRKYGIQVNIIYNTDQVKDAMRALEEAQPERPWNPAMELVTEAYNLTQKAATEANLQEAIAKVDEASRMVKEYAEAMHQWHDRQRRLPELITPF